MKNSAPARAGVEPSRVVVVEDTSASERGIATIVGRDKRYHVCGGAHGFHLALHIVDKLLQSDEGLR